MRILIIGSGAREHALAWKTGQSEKAEEIFVAPGNAGTSGSFVNADIDINNYQNIADFCVEKAIDMVVVGPEQPLVGGLKDFLRQQTLLKDIGFVGPDKQGAKLEGSKDYSKKFMNKYGIPTAKHKTFSANTMKEAFQFLDSLKPPYVLKADGLAAGKGVIIVEDCDDAKSELSEMFSGKFGQAGKTVVIEEFLDGIEYSVFVLTDGDSYKILPVAKDYKRVGEGDTGLNTGGMGAVSPVPFCDQELLKKTEEQIIIPTIEGLKKENIDYVGIIFFGLIKVNNEPFVIEYNVRLGDPEAEVVLPRIKSDLLQLFRAACDKNLKSQQIEIYDEAVAAVVLASGGYPLEYKKNKTIAGLDNVKNCNVFHSGTSLSGSSVVSSGGRVLVVSSNGESINKALSNVYQNIKSIKFDDMYYRNDIGFDLI